MILDRKGQTLVLFIIIIPLILIIGVYVIDIGMVRLKSHKMREVTKMVISSVWQDDKQDYEEEIRTLLVKNEVAVDKLEVYNTDGVLRVKNEIKVDSFLGGVIGFKDFRVKLDIKAYKNGGKLILEDCG